VSLSVLSVPRFGLFTSPRDTRLQGSLGRAARAEARCDTTRERVCGTYTLFRNLAVDSWVLRRPL